VLHGSNVANKINAVSTDLTTRIQPYQASLVAGVVAITLLLRLEGDHRQVMRTSLTKQQKCKSLSRIEGTERGDK
jgi:hypothetical protein